MGWVLGAGTELGRRRRQAQAQVQTAQPALASCGRGCVEVHRVGVGVGLPLFPVGSAVPLPGAELAGLNYREPVVREAPADSVQRIACAVVSEWLRRRPP